MRLEDALAAIDSASTHDEIIGVLRAYAQSPVAGCSQWLTGQIGSADDIATIALELARLRLSTMSMEASLVNAETVFARACMRSAALLDPSGAWIAYQARSSAQGGARDRP